MPPPHGKALCPPVLRRKRVPVRLFVRLFVWLRRLKTRRICALLVAKGSPLAIKPTAIIFTL
ncbi:MAG: hypothetical protein R3E79_30925 [Caldilineaceae bacterium]